MGDLLQRAAAFRWDVPEKFNFGADVVDRIAREDDHLALIWCDAAGREERYRFSDISRLSNQFANALTAAGVGKGDRVIIMLPRLPQWQIAMVGTMKAGAIPLPCIEMLTERDVAFRVEHAGAVGAVTTIANTGKFAAYGDRLKARFAVGGKGDGWSDLAEVMAASAEAFEPVMLDRDDPAAMYYTSGSSGHPKGVVHGARGIFSWRVSAEYWLALGRDDVMWCTADTGWSKAGTSILFGPWSRGSTVVFHDGPFDPKRRLEILQKYGVTVYCAAATEIRRLCDENVGAYDLSALRQTVSAGEAVNPVVVEEWSRLTGKPLRESYGQTETLMTVGNIPGNEIRAGSMGLPLPGADIALLGPDGTPVADGEEGQLALRLPSPQVMLGYWQDPQRTAGQMIENASGRWFLTGDMARRDADGYIWYAGRADDVINSSGYRIGPMEVENAVIEHPAVLECAAVPSPDDARGEVVKAYIVLRAGWDPSPELEKDIQDHVKRTTAPYKYPRRIAFVEALPKTVTGKINRRVLRDHEFGRG